MTATKEKPTNTSKETRIAHLFPDGFNFALCGVRKKPDAEDVNYNYPHKCKACLTLDLILRQP